MSFPRVTLFHRRRPPVAGCYFAGTARLPLPDSRNRSSTHSDQGRSCCQPDHRDIEFGRPRESTTAAAFATTRLAALLSAASPTTPVAHGASASSTHPPESDCSFAATSPASDRRLALPWRRSNPSTTTALSTSCSPRPSSRFDSRRAEAPPAHLTVWYRSGDVIQDPDTDPAEIHDLRHSQGCEPICGLAAHVIHHRRLRRWYREGTAHRRHLWR